MMKYLYVLVSDDTDYYYEQTFLSMTSLRLQMPDAFIVLLVDDTTEANLTGKRAKIHELVNEYKPITIEEHFNKMTRSRWLKTSMRQLITGDFLYIDGDTIIADDLSSIEKTDASLGAIADGHEYLAESAKYNKPSYERLGKAYAKLGINYFDFKIYFNGGVFFCKDNSQGHDFFREWHRLWLHCYGQKKFIDQPSLNQSNHNLGNVIRELDGIWNCQILFDGALKYLYDAKIIHYFATHSGEKPFIPANKIYFDRIKETGSIDPDLMEMLKKPKTLFMSNSRIMLRDKSLREFYSSASCGVSKRIYNTKFGAVIEFFLLKIRENIVKPRRKKLANKKR